jgi:hypothetical protein
VARASIVGVERGVSIADYVRRNGQEVPADVGAQYSPLPDDRILRCLPGDVYFVQQNVEGFKDRSTSIVLFTYDARTRLRLRGAFRAVSGGNGFNIKHHRTTDQSVVPVWVQWPYRRGRFFVRIEIFASKKAFLALVDAPRFSMTYERYNQFVERCVNSP